MYAVLIGSSVHRMVTSGAASRTLNPILSILCIDVNSPTRYADGERPYGCSPAEP